MKKRPTFKDVIRFGLLQFGAVPAEAFLRETAQRLRKSEREEYDELADILEDVCEEAVEAAQELSKEISDKPQLLVPKN